MSELKKTIFISDIHLDENCPKSHQVFMDLLQHIDFNVIDALYILGDLFEVWVGDDNSTIFNQSIINALINVRNKGVKIYFIHGNRDFLIGGKFLQAAGCELLADGSIISLYGSRVLIMHGDTLCTSDYRYQRARKILRNKLFRWLYLQLSLPIRRRIANLLRAKSKYHTQTVLPEIMDVTESAVVDMMSHCQVQYLIHGHTHKPFIHEFFINESKANRIVLGAWHNKGNILIWDERGQQSLIDFDGYDFRFLLN